MYYNQYPQQGFQDHYGLQGHYGQHMQHSPQGQYGHHGQQGQFGGLKGRVLSATEPVVRHGMMEAPHTSYEHALREVAAISYLMGLGYGYTDARNMVESWEQNESFYPHGR